MNKRENLYGDLWVDKDTNKTPCTTEANRKAAEETLQKAMDMASEITTRRITPELNIGQLNTTVLGGLNAQPTIARTPDPGPYGHAIITGSDYSSNHPRLNITQDLIQIMNWQGQTMVEFDTRTGTVEFGKNMNLDAAAQIFWESIGSHTYGTVARTEYSRQSRELEDVKEELKRTKALLNKSLTELGRKYTAESELDEDLPI